MQRPARPSVPGLTGETRVLRTYQTDDWDRYRMDYSQPHRALEPLEREIAVVDGALQALCEAGILPHTRYDHAKMLAHRQAVRRVFEIPWTAITPRMQRLLYADQRHRPAART